MNIEKEMICVLCVGVGGERDGFTDLFEKVNRQLDLGFFLLVLSIRAVSSSRRDIDEISPGLLK